MKSLYLFVIFSFIFANGCFCQDEFDIAYSLIEQNKYLKAVDTLKTILNRSNKANRASPGSVSTFTQTQALALCSSFIGETYTADGNRPKERSPKKFGTSIFAPAIAYIAEEAALRQVVMINEHHTAPKHRIFTANLLDILYHLGYRYLAVEALVTDTSLPMDLKYPSIYTKEPNMANLLRKAKKLGYTLVAYESTDTTDYDDKKPFYADNLREVHQARNLYQVLLKDPRAKILVHVGQGHHMEKAGNDLIMMGEYFKIISGIDPLTIYEPGENTDSYQEQLSYSKYLSERGTPYVVLDAQMRPKLSSKESKGSYDLLLTWPLPVVINGRYDHLLKKNHTKQVLLNVTNPDVGKLVQIIATDPADNVHLDQFVVKRNVGKYASALPKGEYIVQSVDKSGKIIWKKMIKVE